MKTQEKREVKALPKRFRPLSAAAYIFYFLLFCIPLFGEFLMILLSVKAKNVNLRRYAKAVMIITLLCIVIVCILSISGILMFNQIIRNFENQPLPGGIPEEKLALFSALC